MNMQRVVLFDLDGTLTDPGLGITNSVMYALEKFGVRVEDRSELYKFIGPPLLNSFMEFYGFDEEQAEQLEKDVSTLKQSAVMVGDRFHDIVGAKENDIQSIGVLFGYGDREELEDAGADFIAEHPSNIWDSIDDMME